jgi:hypothetical protein
MDQHLMQRPNHYQTLGLKPGARSEEIEQAFAQAVSAFTPRAFGSVTIVSVAYETLRNPARRRAYDQSIGLGPPPPPLTRFAVPASGTMPFVGSRYTAARLAGLEPAPKPPPVEPELVEPERIEAAPAEHDSVGHFLAQSQRLSSPEPLAEPTIPKQPAPAAFTFEPNTAESLGGEATSIRPIVFGAVAMVAAAALFGAWMGLVSTEEVPAEVAATEVKAELPPPGPAAAAIEPAAPLILTEDRTAAAPSAAPIRSAVTERPRAAPLIHDEVASAPQPAVTELAEAPQPVAVEAAASSTARMPLGDAAVARTIRKIGYPCGSVASTAAGSGAGVFVVTCTSGHSYRAAPTNGRYRFKRL